MANKVKTYNLSPARGQALLNYQGRRMPKPMPLYETELLERVRPKAAGKKATAKTAADAAENLLLHGDCLAACAYLKSRNIQIDLVYIDPPFASGANYAKKIYLRNGGQTAMEGATTIGEEVMYGDIWQKEDYLNWLYERLLAIREVMSDTASIYVHLDWHIGHYVKVMMDEIFGEENFVNEITWDTASLNVAGFKGQADKWIYATGNIFYYRKNSDGYIFNKQYIPRSEEFIKKHYTNFENGEPYRITRQGNKLYLKDDKGEPVTDIWKDILSFNYAKAAAESVNYTTQKPEALLERIIKASSDAGMLVADFFQGSGTTAKVAHALGRNFIACDVGLNALQTSRDRLAKAGAHFEVLKINDGLRLFRNPVQTEDKIFSLLDGFKSRAELELGEFWYGGMPLAGGSYAPVRFTGMQKTLDKAGVDYCLEEIYALEEHHGAREVIILYAHKTDDIHQAYVDKAVRAAGKTECTVRLLSLDELLGAKRDMLFGEDNARVVIAKQADAKQADVYEVTIAEFHSPYLAAKIDDFNANKTVLDAPDKQVKISERGLELIEAVQFDLRGEKVWRSELELEDKASPKSAIKGVYKLPTDKFKMKIRNIAGDEVVVDSEAMETA